MTSILHQSGARQLRSPTSAGRDALAVAEPPATRLVPMLPVMFILSFCGMATGLAIDLKTVLPATLASLCLGPHSLLDGVVAHTALLPATNLLALASGFIAIGLMAGAARSGESGPARRRQIAFYMVCNFVMLAGMLLGAALGPRLAAPLGFPWSAGAMLAAMAVGMGAGMAAATAAARFARAVFQSPR